MAGCLGRVSGCFVGCRGWVSGCYAGHVGRVPGCFAGCMGLVPGCFVECLVGCPARLGRVSGWFVGCVGRVAKYVDGRGADACVLCWAAKSGCCLFYWATALSVSVLRYADVSKAASPRIWVGYLWVAKRIGAAWQGRSVDTQVFVSCRSACRCRASYLAASLRRLCGRGGVWCHGCHPCVCTILVCRQVTSRVVMTSCVIARRMWVCIHVGRRGIDFVPTSGQRAMETVSSKELLNC